MSAEAAASAPARGLLRVSSAEALTGLGVVAASLGASPDLRGALGAAMGLLLLAAATTDARRFLVPDVFAAPAFALGLLDAALADGGSYEAALRALAQALAAAGLFLLIREAYARWRGREGLGLGDVKLAGVAGAWLGSTMLPLAIEAAALSAIAVYVFRQRRRGRSLRATSRLPFGATLAPAIWLGWLIEIRFPPLA